MSSLLRFLVVLVMGLAVLASGALVLVTSNLRAWFERDLQLRAELAVNSSRRDLARQWESGNRQALTDALSEISRDVRIMAIGACGLNGTLAAKSPDWPDSLTCAGLPAGPYVTSVPGGRVH